MKEVTEEKKNNTTSSSNAVPAPSTAVSKRSFFTEDNGNRSFSGFFLAFIIFSTAASYMFMGSKIKNVMKMEVPRATWKSERTTSESAEQHFKSKARESANAKQGAEEKTENVFKDSFGADRIKELHNLVVTSHLATLELSASDFNERAIKAAYREMVMKFHPDRIALDDPKRDAYHKKFHAVSNSYKVLLDILNPPQKK
jgi:hypothetical protein